MIDKQEVAFLEFITGVLSAFHNIDLVGVELFTWLCMLCIFYLKQIRDLMEALSLKPHYFFLAPPPGTVMALHPCLVLL